MKSKVEYLEDFAKRPVLLKMLLAFVRHRGEVFSKTSLAYEVSSSKTTYLKNFEYFVENGILVEIKHPKRILYKLNEEHPLVKSIVDD